MTKIELIKCLFGWHTYFVDCSKYKGLATWDGKSFKCKCGKILIVGNLNDNS